MAFILPFLFLALYFCKQQSIKIYMVKWRHWPSIFYSIQMYVFYRKYSWIKKNSFNSIYFTFTTCCLLNIQKASVYSLWRGVRGYVIMSLSRITTWSTWSQQLSEINNIMNAVKALYTEGAMPFFQGGAENLRCDVSRSKFTFSLQCFARSVLLFFSYRVVRERAQAVLHVSLLICITYRSLIHSTKMHETCSYTSESAGGQW